MKKILVLILALSLVFAFAACGKEDKSGDLSYAGDESEAGVTNELETEETESETSEETATLPNETAEQDITSRADASDVASLISQISTTAANVISKTTKAVTSVLTTKPTTTTTKPSTTAPETTTAPTTTAPSTTEPTTAPRSGQKFAFTTTDMSGNTVSLANYSDAKLIMINMWEPWCGPCVREMPDLQKLYDNYKSKGFLILGAASSTPSEVNEVVRDLGITYPIINCNTDFNVFYTGSVPTTVFIDGDGYVLTPDPIVGSRSYDVWEGIMLELLDAVS